MPATSGRDILEWHIAFRDWMHTYPELFQTRLHKDCFLQLALLTLDTKRLDSLKPLYRGLPYAENSIRAYLRTLANAGWIRFEAPCGTDRRTVSLRVEPTFQKAVQDYIGQFRRLQAAPAGQGSSPASVGLAPGEEFRVRA